MKVKRKRGMPWQALPPSFILSRHWRAIVSILGDEPLSLRVGAIGILHDMSTLRPHRQQSCEPTLLALHLIHSLDVHLREGVGHEGKQIARTGVVHQATIAIYRLLHLHAEEAHLAP